MVLPSWLHDGAPPELGSPVRAMTPVAAASVLASTSIQLRTLLAVVNVWSLKATIARRSPVDQWAAEKVEMPWLFRASAALPPAPRKGGGAPTVPASTSMLAIAFGHPAAPDSAKPTYCPPGAEVWHPMQVVVVSVTWPGMSTCSTDSSPIEKHLRAVPAEVVQ